MSDTYQFLPPLSRSEYEALKADIAARGGLHSPVVVDENGQVLDGHHRLKACEELGIDPSVEPRSFPSEAHKEAFALAANLSRRQLSPEQRATVREYQRQVYLDLREAGCTQPEAAGLVGASTELAKILQGWGDYLLYGFGKDENLVFQPWTLADLDIFRRCWRAGLGERQANGDGSSDFLAFQWDQFPPDFIIAKSWWQGGLLG